VQAGSPAFEDTYTHIKGMGRFEGIQGTASFTGKLMAALTPGGPADCYTDFTETYTLPAR
jgi:hypothetical protein